MQINVVEKTQIEGDLLHNAESIIVKFQFYAHNLKNTSNYTTGVAINLYVSSGRGTVGKKKYLPTPEQLFKCVFFFFFLTASVLQVISMHLLKSFKMYAKRKRPIPVTYT